MPDPYYKRNASKAKVYRGETFSDSRRAWTEVNGQKIILFRSEGKFPVDIPEDDTEHLEEYEAVITNEYGEEVSLFFTNGKVKYNISLTGLTEMELDAFQDFVNLAVEASRPVVRVKDKIAKELFDEQGIDAFPRLYRGVPKVSVRKGEEPLYSESLRRRPFGILEVDGRIRLEAIATREERELAQRESEDEVSHDGQSENGEPASMGEVGGNGQVAPGLQPADGGEGDSSPDPRGD